MTLLHDTVNLLRAIMIISVGMVYLIAIKNQRKTLRSDALLPLFLVDYSLAAMYLMFGFTMFVDGIHCLPKSCLLPVLIGLLLYAAAAFLMFHPVALWNKKSPRARLLKETEAINKAHS